MKTKKENRKRKQISCKVIFLRKHNILYLFILWECFNNYLNDVVRLPGQYEELGPFYNVNNTTGCQAKLYNWQHQTYLLYGHSSRSNGIAIMVQIRIAFFGTHFLPGFNYDVFPFLLTRYWCPQLIAFIEFEICQGSNFMLWN